MENTLNKVREALKEHVQMIVRKNGNMTPPDIDILNKDLCALECLQRLEGMSDVDYSEGSSGNSYRRSRAASGRFSGRDSGSYDGDSGNSSRYYDGSGNSGYSGHSKRDRLIDHLEQLIDAAQNDEQRAFLQDWLDRVNNSR